MTEKDDPNFVERFTVRMPDGMRDAIAGRAKKNGRSMNSEIVQILQDALSGGAINMDAEFVSVFNQVTHAQHETIEEFDAVNEKVDWLIDKLMEKIDNESANVRLLLKAKQKYANKKPN
ncbi:Arc family DNA-binding protein [Yersinia enterocolitica]|uniref:Arc family DNA-binding protein n=1 Tax=Yersinia TaxID=629 RepID=UPI000680B7C6|nr:Arc family DNA-binding protein [Yersinia intermedia]MCB5324990.1 Arc family DNA-binding protein [Yersinia intermedia]